MIGAEHLADGGCTQDRRLHFASPSGRSAILTYLLHDESELLPKNRRVAVVGLTATPYRMEYVDRTGTLELVEIFSKRWVVVYFANSTFT